jgi:antibiotic biosynthesis monooxygenase (ABM) superfamily enzyme
MVETPGPPDQPVTVMVSRQVRPEAREEFERWLSGIIGEASAFPGHLGANVIRPLAPGQEYTVIFRFDTVALLKAWEDSNIRAQWLAQVEPLTVGEARMEKVSGLEFWFSLPGNAASKPPPRWKMAIVTVAALYPLILFLVPTLARFFTGLPGALATLLTASIMVALMTWVVMPAFIRALAWWLFPARR